jgi:hypothetical protein
MKLTMVGFELAGKTAQFEEAVSIRPFWQQESCRFETVATYSERYALKQLK